MRKVVTYENLNRTVNLYMLMRTQNKTKMDNKTLRSDKEYDRLMI